MKNYENEMLQTLSSYRTQLLNHPIYDSIHTIQELGIFMQHHVFAVWDYMSLLKSLQHKTIGYDGPWIPRKTPNTRRFLNRLILQEESDTDLLGNVASHFELYKEAIIAAGASTESIERLILGFARNMRIDEAMDFAKPPIAARRFTTNTLNLAEHGSAHELAGALILGREDLIPIMFTQLVKELDAITSEDLSALSYYFQRHIQIEENHKGKGRFVLQELCGTTEKKWNEATQAAKKALQHRIALWDGILKACAIHHQDLALKN